MWNFYDTAYCVRRYGRSGGGGDDSRASQLLAIRIAKLRILKGRTRVEVLEVDGGSFESSGAAAERVE